MAEMVQAVYRLSDPERRAMILTRTKVIANLPEDAQERIVRSRAAIAAELPGEINRTDTGLTMEALAQLPPDRQAALRASMAKAGFGFPQ